MKRFAALILTVMMVLGLAACETTEGGSVSTGSGGETAELALITDIGTIDDKSFNQGAWEGLEAYAEENNITYKYYQPLGKNDQAYLDAIELAVNNGAKLIVTPGYLFEVSVFHAQDLYPDVHFVLVDGTPHDEDYNVFKTGENTVGILYAETEAGFLAGYAAVKDGNTSLGFMGGLAVPAVVRFGYGFVQGADYAAAELGLDEISINYHYTGDFVPSAEAQTMAASWFNSGVEIIFACGGGMGASVMAAAEEAGKKVIGVDIDQSYESDSVITSSVKGLAVSVYDAITAFYGNEFPGGEVLIFSALNDGVGLPMETSRFDQFTQDDYEAIYAKLVAQQIPLTNDVDADNKQLAVSDIKVKNSKVTLVE